MFSRTELIEEKNRILFDSYLGYNSRWIDYYSSYKRVIDDIVESVESGTRKIDEVSLPLLFMIRHTIELSLKENILFLQKHTSIRPKKNMSVLKTHSIDYLYFLFVANLLFVLKKYNANNSVIDQVNKNLYSFSLLKKKLHFLDKGSFSFRYPVDTKNIRNFEWLAKENLFDLINQFYAIQIFLLYTKSVISELDGFNE